MKRKILARANYISLAIILSMLMAGFVLLVTASVAWLFSGILIDSEDTEFFGSSLGSYFDGGDGTSPEEAYVINTPTHLYNLSWLQNKGAFSDRVVYFKLGKSIDMKASLGGGAIPPIGNNTYPFTGIFDGGGNIISNLFVSTLKSDWIEQPAGSSDYTDSNVGLFAKISSGASITIFNLDKIEVKTGVNDSTVGIICGYVDASLGDIGVYNGIITTTSGIKCTSKYTLIGDVSSNILWEDKPELSGPGGDLVIDPNDYANLAANEFSAVGDGEVDPVPYSMPGSAYFIGNLTTMTPVITGGGPTFWDMRNYASNKTMTSFVSDGSREHEFIASIFDEYNASSILIHSTDRSFDTNGNLTQYKDMDLPTGETIRVPKHGIWFKPKGTGRIAMVFAPTNKGSDRYMMLYKCQRTSSTSLRAVEMIEYHLPVNSNKNFKNGHAGYFEYTIPDEEKGLYEYFIGATNVSNHSIAEVGFVALMLAGTDESNSESESSSKKIANIDYITAPGIDVAAENYDTHDTLLSFSGTTTGAGSMYFLAKASGTGSTVYYLIPKFGITIKDDSAGKESQGSSNESDFAKRGT